MDYSLFDLRAGFRVKQFDFSVYANNIADRRGVTRRTTTEAEPRPQIQRLIELCTSSRGPLACGSTGICSRNAKLNPQWPLRIRARGPFLTAGTSRSHLPEQTKCAECFAWAS